MNRIPAVMDSNILVGLLNPLDHRRQQAEAIYFALRSSETPLIFLDCVIAEALSTSLRRLEEKGDLTTMDALFERLRSVIPDDRITWIFPDVISLYSEIIKLIRSSGGTLNFHDALIALTCRERGITTIVSLDADFDQIPWLTRISQPPAIHT